MAPNPASTTMPPCGDEPLLMIAEDHSEVSLKALKEVEDTLTPGVGAEAATKKQQVLQPIKWGNVVFFSTIHLLVVWAVLYLPQYSWKTYVWGFLVTQFAGFGVTGGAHRLWTHRAYKANTPLKLILMLGYCMAGMNSIFDWVRDHRVHHKFSETDADPHNARRGFFFAHVGWLLMKKHPEVLRRGKTVDMSDITNDPICAFQKKYHIPLFFVLCHGIPCMINIYALNEPWHLALLASISRWVIGINFVWSVNSAAHLYGSHPFNKYINPADNRFVSLMCMGEGWHNYHHVFPWDYKAAELGNLNTTMHLIKFFERIGWAYDLKTAPDTLIKKVATRYGDGTHPEWASHAPEVPEAAVKDPSVVESLPAPALNGVCKSKEA